MNTITHAPSLAQGRVLVSLTAIALTGLVALPASPAASTHCPSDLSGRYVLTAHGAESARRAASAVLPLDTSGYPRVLVAIDGSAVATHVGFRVRDGGHQPYRHIAFVRGTDYECKDGWIGFRRKVATGWKEGETWYEGEATVHLARTAGNRLAVRIAFSGRERVTIYSYDSARLSLPKPFTGRTFEETLHWPEVDDATVDVPPVVRDVQPAQVVAVRNMLSDRVLGPARLAGATLRGNEVLVTLKVPLSKDLAPLEQRLRAAGIAYRVSMAPTWSDRHHHMEILVDPRPSARVPDEQTRPTTAAPAQAAPAPVQARLTLQQVREELERAMNSPLVNVQAVVAAGDEYVATLTLLPGMSSEQALARLKARSTLIAQVETVSDTPRSDLPRARDASWRLRTRPPR